MLYQIHTGNKDCDAVGFDLKSITLDVTGTCQTLTKPDGSGKKVYYKASSAKCFKWYAEFASEGDCNSNQNQVADADATFPFLQGEANDKNSYDKMCNIHNANAYRTTCSSVENGAIEAGEPDMTMVLDKFLVPNCAIIWYNIISGSKSKKSLPLTVDGTCHNFEWEGKTVWYKAIKTTDTTSYRPGEEPPLDGSAVCKNNKIENGGNDNNGKRCITWDSKP